MKGDRILKNNIFHFISKEVSKILNDDKIFELLTRNFYSVLNHRVKNC